MKLAIAGGVSLTVVVLAAALIARASTSAPAAFNADPAFPRGLISGTASHQIPRLERVASELAGRQAVVNCWSNRDWPREQAWQGSHHYTRLVDAVGITYPRNHRIQLSPFVCQVLAQVLAGSPHQPLFTAWAVTVLAHESAHASGIRAEDKAECRAIETEPRAAELLGIPKATAEQLQHIYRGTVYPYDQPRYRTPPCAEGKPGVVVPDAMAVPRTSARWRTLSSGPRPAFRAGETMVVGVPSARSGPVSALRAAPRSSPDSANFSEGHTRQSCSTRPRR